MKNKIIDLFSKIELFTCSVCGSFMDKKENEAGEGECYKCWEK